MSRVDKILNHHLADGLVESFGIIPAYCYTLGAEAACELLRRSVAERPDYRNFAIRKVCADAETEFLRCHAELVRNLIKDFRTADYRLRQSMGFVLSRLAEVAATPTRRKIQPGLFIKPRIAATFGWILTISGASFGGFQPLRAWQGGGMRDLVRFVRE